MNRWILKSRIRLASGNEITEVKCPECGYCENVQGDHRNKNCYCCEALLYEDEEIGGQEG